MDGQYKDCQELKDSYDDCRFVSATYNEEAAVSFSSNDIIHIVPWFDTPGASLAWVPWVPGTHDF